MPNKRGPAFWSGVALALFLVAFSVGAQAQQKCYEWRHSGSSTWHKNPSGAAAEYCASLSNTGSASTNGDYGWTCVNIRPASSGFPSMVFDRGNQRTSGCPGSCTTTTIPPSGAILLTSREDPGGCPSCPAAGQQQTLTGDGGITSIPSSTCRNGCEFKQAGKRVSAKIGVLRSWAAEFESTGSSCSAKASSADSPNHTGAQADCDNTGRICLDKGEQRRNCGIYNGNRVCVESTPPGGCVAYGDGGAACRGTNNGADPPATPPAPNNGTPGTPAEPDAQVVSPSGSTVNYYTSTTVSGSSSAPTTGAPGSGVVTNPVGSDEGEDADGDGEPDGSGSGSGDGGSCEGPGCNAGVPDLAEIGTLSEAFGGFWSDLQEVPIIDAAASVAPTIGTGACPNWQTTFSVWGQSFEMNFDFLCSFWESITPALTVVSLVFFGFAAFRILMSA